MDKLFVAEEDLLLDAYRLGVQVFNSGFRPSFIVGLWRGGSSVGIAVQECLQHLGWRPTTSRSVPPTAAWSTTGAWWRASLRRSGSTAPSICLKA